MKCVSCNADVPSQSLVQDDVQFVDRICRKCTCGQAGNEQHVLLFCQATESVREKFRCHMSWPSQRNIANFLKANETMMCAIFVHVAIHVYNARPNGV